MGQEIRLKRANDDDTDDDDVVMRVFRNDNDADIIFAS